MNREPKIPVRHSVRVPEKEKKGKETIQRNNG